MSKNDLTFFYPQLSGRVTTEISQIEDYSNNLVVAPTIGTLVTYFSDDRPTSYIAESWHAEGNKWIFNIRNGFKCEDGEEITSSNFAENLARTIKIFSKGSTHPIFQYLYGYHDFISSKKATLDGIYSRDNQLIFEFTKVIRSGFLEHLSMAPFGYVCRANFQNDNWKDSTQIISSGPYRLQKIENQNQFNLIRRDDWHPDYTGGAKSITIRAEGYEEFKNHPGPKLLESHSTEDNTKEFQYVRQMPQVLLIIKLNSKNKAFSDKNIRQRFLKEYRKQFNSYSFESQTYFKTDTFFYNDRIAVPDTHSLDNIEMEPRHLVMKIMDRGPGTPNDANRHLVERTALALGWTVEFDSSPYTSFKETYSSNKYDLYMQGAEVGGGFEGWVVDMLFCSDVGDQWPDPSGRICELTKQLESEDPINSHDANQKFHDILNDDAVVIPTFHRGGFYLMSSDISIDSLSPMITRIRFEQLRIKD